MSLINRMLAGCLALFALSGAGADAPAPYAGLDVEQPKIRMAAPAFTLPDLNGHARSLSDFKGKLVLLNFWASWCAPCREEMPGMQTLWQNARERGLVILAVAADRGDKAQVAAFARKLALSFPILLDPDGTVRNRYEVSMLPVSYLIGQDGKILGRIIGSRAWESPQATALIDYLLRQ